MISLRSFLLLCSLTLLSVRETTASDVNNNNNNSDDPFADFDLVASDDTTSMCYIAGSSIAGALALPIKYSGMVAYYVLSPVIWVTELARSILGKVFDILLFLPRLIFRIIWFCLMIIPNMFWWLFTAVAAALGPLVALAFGAVLLIVLAYAFRLLTRRLIVLSYAFQFLSSNGAHGRTRPSHRGHCCSCRAVGLLLGAVFVALVAVIMSGIVQGVVGMILAVIMQVIMCPFQLFYGGMSASLSAFGYWSSAMTLTWYTG